MPPAVVLKLAAVVAAERHSPAALEGNHKRAARAMEVNWTRMPALEAVSHKWGAGRRSPEEVAAMTCHTASTADLVEGRRNLAAGDLPGIQDSPAVAAHRDALAEDNRCDHTAAGERRTGSRGGPVVLPCVVDYERTEVAPWLAATSLVVTFAVASIPRALAVLEVAGNWTHLSDHHDPPGRGNGCADGHRRFRSHRDCYCCCLCRLLSHRPGCQQSSACFGP